MESICPCMLRSFIFIFKDSLINFYLSFYLINKLSTYLSIYLRDEKQPSDNVESIAENMHFFPPERYLDGDDLMFEYDPDTIKKCTDALGKFLFLMYFELGYPKTIDILHCIV